MGCIICKNLSESVDAGIAHYKKSKQERNQTYVIELPEKSDEVVYDEPESLPQDIIDNDEITVEPVKQTVLDPNDVLEPQELLKHDGIVHLPVSECEDVVSFDSDFEMVSKSDESSPRLVTPLPTPC